MTVVDVNVPIQIVGLEEAPISDIVLRDIQIKNGKQPNEFKDCENILMENVVVNGKNVSL